jgi:methionine synthase / methylenetetrahydrofolate reductase(NADPH)
VRRASRGLENSVSEINVAGARLAREAAQRAGHPVLVAGSVGPALSAPAVRRVPVSAPVETLREQIVALCDWVDLLILETFGDDGRTLRGEDPAEAAAVLSDLRVTALGANCTTARQALGLTSRCWESGGRRSPS